jgi:hypothetical protein
MIGLPLDLYHPDGVFGQVVIKGSAQGVHKSQERKQVYHKYIGFVFDFDWGFVSVLSGFRSLI